MRVGAVPVSTAVFFAIFFALLALILALNILAPRFHRSFEQGRVPTFEAYVFVVFRSGMVFGGGNIARVVVYEREMALVSLGSQQIPTRDIEQVRRTTLLAPALSMKVGRTNICAWGSRGTIDRLFTTLTN